MDSKQIETLLQRYWACETSLQEEAQLRDFFCGEDVPSSLLPYRELFIYQKQQGEASLSTDFDARMLALVEADAPVVKAKRVTLFMRLLPMIRAAAAIALLLLLGSLLEHSFIAERQDLVATDTIGNQISVPSVALTDEVMTAENDTRDVVKTLKE